MGKVEPNTNVVEVREEADNLWTLAKEVLGSEQYTAMWLRYGEDLSVAEVASAMRKTQVGIRVLLHRSRSLLVKTMTERSMRKSPQEVPSMIRWILRWIIGQSIDSGRPIPKWLQCRIDRDPELREYQRQLDLLLSNLRRDAARIGPETASRPKVGLAEIHHGSISSGVRSHQRLYWIGTTIAVAASIVILFFYFDSVSNKSELAHRTPPREIRNPMNEDEAMQIREQLLAASKSLRNRITTEYKSKKELLESRRLIEQLPSANQLVATTESMGVASAKPLAMISQGMKQERVRVENDIRNGITYFSQTVPKRMMSLVLNQ